MPNKPDCYTLGSTTNKELQQQSQEIALCHKQIKQERFKESNFGTTSLTKTESLKPSGTENTTASAQTINTSKHFTNSFSHHTDAALSHRCSNKSRKLLPKAAVPSTQFASQTGHKHSCASDVKGKVVCEKNDVDRNPRFESGGKDINPFYSAVNYKQSNVQQQQTSVKICPTSTKNEEIAEFSVLRPISPSVLKTVMKKERPEMPPDQKSNEDMMKYLSGDVYQGNDDSDEDDVIITEVEPGKRKKKNDLCALLLVEGDSSSSKAASDDNSIAVNTPKKLEAKQERNGCDVTRAEPETESTLQSFASDVKENVASSLSLLPHNEVNSLNPDVGSANGNSQDKLQCSTRNVDCSAKKQPSSPRNESENRSRLPEPKLQTDTINTNRFHKMQECAKEIQRKLQSLGKAALADERIMALKNRFQSEKIATLQKNLDHHKIVALETLFETELHQTKAVQAGTFPIRSNSTSNLSDEVICIDGDDDDIQETDNRTDSSTKSPAELPVPMKRNAESECQNFEENSDSKMKSECPSLSEPDEPPPAKCRKLNDTGGRLVKDNDTSVNVVLDTNSSARNNTTAHSSVVNTRIDNSAVEVRSLQSPEVKSEQLQPLPEVRSPQLRPSPEARSPQLRPSPEVPSPKSPLKNTARDPLLTTILNDTSEVTRRAHNEVKSPYLILKQRADDLLLGYPLSDKCEKTSATKSTSDLFKDPRVPMGNETNSILLATLQKDNNEKSDRNEGKHLTTTGIVCNRHTSNGLGRYSAQQKDNQVGSSLRNLEEFVNQNQSAPRWNHTRDTPRRDNSFTDGSFQNPHQTHTGANTRLTHELPRPPSPELASISWDEIGKDWLEPCTKPSTHTTPETVNTGNMGREPLPHTPQRSSCQPHTMPYDSNQDIVPSEIPYNNYGSAGTYPEGYNNPPCTLSNQYNMPTPQDNVNSYSSMRYPEPNMNYGYSNNVNVYGFNYGGLTRQHFDNGGGASGIYANRSADTYGVTSAHMMGDANRMIGPQTMTDTRLTVRDRWKWNIMNRTRMQKLSSGGREIPRSGFF